MILAIDPGSRKIGLAILDGDRLVASGQFSRSSTKTVNRIATLRADLTKWIYEAGVVPEFDIDHIVMEFGRTLRRRQGRDPAKMRVHDLAAGVILGKVFEIFGYDKIELVEPSKWKGNKTKEATKFNVEMIFSKQFQEDEADAVGIALWFNTELKLRAAT